MFIFSLIGGFLLNYFNHKQGVEIIFKDNKFLFFKVCFIIPIIEELIFRSILCNYFLLSQINSSILFSSLHLIKRTLAFPWFTYNQKTVMIVYQLISCFILSYTLYNNTLLYCILVHISHNLIISIMVVKDI